jgi:hypothetical protein
MRRLMVLLLLMACSRSPDWAEVAAQHHAEADRLIDAGNRVGARAELEAIITAAPHAGEDGRRVSQDAYFRLARLALDDHDPARAARDADAGLALGGGEDLFVANLLVVRGAAHEALGEAAAAVSVYQRALRINERLLHEEVGPR